MSLQELDQDPFDPDEFVNRLAWRTMGGVHSKEEDFDSMTLHAAFEKAIRDLKDMKRRVQQQVERLEVDCQEEVRSNQTTSAQLLKQNQEAFTHFKGLDERINFVATKVVHLGDQLEGVNTPRTRAAEAQMLIKYFSEFLADDKLKSDIFTDPFQLQAAADVIQKLYLIAQELPSNGEFDKVKEKISTKYEDIENQLLQEFRQAHYEGDKRSMKRLAAVLSHFKGYTTCIDIFIEESQKGSYQKTDIFEDIPPLCASCHKLIHEVFNNPDTIMSKLVCNIYFAKLQKHIDGQLSNHADLEQYLQTLYILYQKTTTLSNQLSTYKLGNDTGYLNKLCKHIFGKYLDGYVRDECRFLQQKYSAILQRYYDTKNHQKRAIQSGGMHDFRRDLQTVIGTKANINLGPTIENYGGETFLSQELAINVLQESKLAFKRCKLLSSRIEVPTHAHKIFELLVQYLCTEHIDYALELGLQAIPLSDPKSEPQIYFFEVVTGANTMFHLFEKQFNDSLLPLVSSSPKHSESLHRKREIMESMENKIDLGLDRTVAAIVGWVRQILITEQKKSDFKPDTDDMQMYSPACAHVVKYVNTQLEAIRFGLDGKNIDATLTEFGIRVHRVIYEHFQQYQYNSMGAMLAICDVNEYRKCVKEFHIPVVTELMDTLHALCNLLVVVPDNLKQVCTGEQLSSLDRSIMHSFVQLRADYKTARLASQFR